MWKDSPHTYTRTRATDSVMVFCFVLSLFELYYVSLFVSLWFSFNRCGLPQTHMYESIHLLSFDSGSPSTEMLNGKDSLENVWKYYSDLSLARIYNKKS